MRDLDGPDITPLEARRLRRALTLTRLGLVAERAARAFWPAWSIAALVLAVLLLGLPRALPLEAVWALGVLSLVAMGGALVWGALRFRWPGASDAAARLDATLPGRPLAALTDKVAIGAEDRATQALWAAHRARMARRLAAARAVPGDLRLAPRDPYGLRHVALIALAMGLLFGQAARVGEIGMAAPASAMAEGPSWEGWIVPPAHTGLPTLYLPDQPPGALTLPEGAEIAIRLYGPAGALTVDETVSARTEPPVASAPEHRFAARRTGRLAVTGRGGAEWIVEVTPDLAPLVLSAGPMERGTDGRTELPFSVEDDHGVAGGEALIAPDLAAADRRHGLAADPEAREALALDLPLPITGDRTAFEEVIVGDLAEHPFAGLPVTVRITALDAAGNVSAPFELAGTLPARRFFDPLARAVVEQRRDLLWSRANAGRAASILRAVSNRPEDAFDRETTYLRLRFAVRRLENLLRADQLTSEAVDEIAAALWAVAVEIEEGRLQDALERLREAQERLQDAIENGATDEEIAELMQELREAMQQYMQQLAEQAQPPQDGQQGQQQPGQQITQDQIEEMLRRLQELMEQGEMEQAEALLRQLQQMMENMQVTQGQSGQGGPPSPGQQAMEGLGETLRQQQGLSDEAFRDLQEQQGQGQAGQSQENAGRGGDGMGRGQEHQQGQGQGSQGQQRAENGGGGQQDGNLADRQGQLRRELERQRGALNQGGTPGGEEAGRALDRAEGAMDRAEDALRRGDTGQALGDQADAMEALREGMRALADEMQQQEQAGGQAQGQGQSETDGAFRGDPLGRAEGTQGRIGGDDPLALEDDVYRRAQDLFEELRRRAGERERSETEREYLERLIDPF